MRRSLCLCSWISRQWRCFGSPGVQEVNKSMNRGHDMLDNVRTTAQTLLAGGTCASVWTIQPLLECLPSLATLRRPRIQNCSTESKTHHEAFLGSDNVNWVYRSGCTINLTREQGNGPALCEGLVSFVIGLFSLLTG